jgi:hypothetical protein
LTTLRAAREASREPANAQKRAPAALEPDELGRYAWIVTVKEQLHQAVEAMTEEEANVALRTLADASGDPVAWMLAHAPLDDEPETDEERGAVAEAKRERGTGVPGIPLEQVKRELGLT